MKTVLVLLVAIPLLGAPRRDWKTATLVETTRVNEANQAYAFDLGDRTVVCADPAVNWVRINGSAMKCRLSLTHSLHSGVPAHDRRVCSILNAEREFEPESLPPRITFRNVINGLSRAKTYTAAYVR
jgi:hypothetical protein